MNKAATPPLPDLATLPLENEPDSRQFVLQVGRYRARIEYDQQGDRMFLTRTDVPLALVGQDVGAVLTERVFTWIEDNKLKLVPLCPDVKAYLRQHTAWKRLLLKGLHL